jgi:putative sigma-54 modulation protein
MNLTISGHHLEVTPALRSYVTGKLDRITRHFDQVVDVKVLLTVEKQKEKDKRQRAECNIHVKGNDLFAESSHQDLYAAVDDLVDKLEAKNTAAPLRCGFFWEICFRRVHNPPSI